MIEEYCASFKKIKNDFLIRTEGIHRNLLLYMITCNIFKIRPKAGDENFWPFQYFDRSDQASGEEEPDYTADFFTERAISFCKSTTVRETFGLTLKDVMGMDYGTLLYLEKIANKIDEARARQMDELDNNIKGGGKKDE